MRAPDGDGLHMADGVCAVVGYSSSDGSDDGSGGGAPAPPDAARRAVECGSCNARPARYRCPRCGAPSCSAGCVKAHKAARGCSGARERTPYAAIGQFTDKIVKDGVCGLVCVISCAWGGGVTHRGPDFVWLEDVRRSRDAAARRLRDYGTTEQARGGRNRRRGGGRGRGGRGGGGDDAAAPAPPRIPPLWRRLVEAALRRGTVLRVMPEGMSRHDANTSRVAEGDGIEWRVTWEFVGAGVVVTSDAVDERRTLWECVAAYVTPLPVCVFPQGDAHTRARWAAHARNVFHPRTREGADTRVMQGNTSVRARLGVFGGASLDSLEFAMAALGEEPPAGALPARRYHWLDGGATLREALRGTTLIEHPTVMVTMPGARAQLGPRAAPDAVALHPTGAT